MHRDSLWGSLLRAVRHSNLGSRAAGGGIREPGGKRLAITSSGVDSAAEACAKNPTRPDPGNAAATNLRNLAPDH